MKRTKTSQQIHEQWQRIKSYVKQRGKLFEYFRKYARYCNRMADYNGESTYWTTQHGFHYTECNNAPVPVEIYAAK